MFRIAVVAEDRQKAESLCRSLAQAGYAAYPLVEGENVVSQVAEKAPDMVLIEVGSYSRVDELASDIKGTRNLPVVALLPAGPLVHTNGYFSTIDDFIAKPLHAGELELRVGRLLSRTKAAEGGEEMSVGELRIDLAKCEVTVAGRPVMLTFKEYELLKFLVANRGRVCTREALLNKVWGYDYYGGDRTVDVHIRRLRSKIEDATHTFVETVRNIGYRIRVDQ